jgi:plasmid stabilization system protein ParE
LRIVPFKTRTAIAFEIDEDNEVVRVLRVFYGGQDYDAALSPTRRRTFIKPRN